MKLTIALLVLLVSCALAWPQYKRKGPGPKRPDSSDEDGESASKGSDEPRRGECTDDIERKRACLRVAEKCGERLEDQTAPEAGETARQILHVLRAVEEDQDRQKCEELIADTISERVEKREVTLEDAQKEIETIEKACICDGDETEPPVEPLKARLLRMLEEEEPAEENAEDPCKQALEAAGIDMEDVGEEETEGGNGEEQGPPTDEQTVRNLVRGLLRK